MTTRIDGTRATVDTNPLERVETRRKTDTAQTAGSASKSDRVVVSQDAALMANALKAANEAPGIRQDKVEAARQALAAGTLGANADVLADKMIDHLLADK